MELGRRTHGRLYWGLPEEEAMGWGAEDFLDDFKRPRRGLRTVGILGLWDSRAKAPGANA